MLLPLLDLGDDPCGCCHADHVMLAWHGLAWQVDQDGARLAQKADGIRGEDGEDAFVPDELDIAQRLSASWEKQGSKAKTALLASVATSFSPYNFQAALDEVAIDMDSLFNEAEPGVRQAIRNVLGIGAGRAGITNQSLRMSPYVGVTEEALLNATRYFTNRFFRQTIIPAMHVAIDRAIAGTEATPLADIHAAISGHFRRVPYWNLVANVAASRGYHYGLLKGYQNLGNIAYRIVATIDDRTSVICQSMNGREFLVADAVHQLEALAADPDPEAAKTRTPWLKPAAIDGKTSQELSAMGFLMPPFHPLCRTTVMRI